MAISELTMCNSDKFYIPYFVLLLSFMQVRSRSVGTGQASKASQVIMA